MNEQSTDRVALTDRFSRTISYLRLSITDRCNLRCLYCMPCIPADEKDGQQIIKYIDSQELLSYEEMFRIVRIAVSLGMTKIRLTGGEPLIRRGIMDFISRLSKLDGLKQIRLTTNGVLLGKYAATLLELGVNHLNISLDTLEREKFTAITGRDVFDTVFSGIEKAAEKGFFIKLNVVAMKGVNDDEFVRFARLAIDTGIHVRFIEFMPIGKDSGWKKDKYITAKDIRETYLQEYRFTPLAKNEIDGPARVYTITDSRGKKGKLGFISPISHHFCDQCNRLRLTSEGRLRACLLQDSDTDLKKILRAGCTDEEIEKAIRKTILNKPQNHGISENGNTPSQPVCQSHMSRIGG